MRNVRHSIWFRCDANARLATVIRDAQAWDTLLDVRLHDKNQCKDVVRSDITHLDD